MAVNTAAAPIVIGTYDAATDLSRKSTQNLLGTDKDTNTLVPQIIAMTYTQLGIESGVTRGFTEMWDFAGTGTRRRDFPTMGRTSLGTLHPTLGAPAATAGQTTVELQVPTILANSFLTGYEEHIMFAGYALNSYAQQVKMQVVEHVQMHDRIRLLEAIRGARTAIEQVEMTANNTAVAPTYTAAGGSARYHVRDGICDDLTATGAKVGWSKLTIPGMPGQVGGTAIILPEGQALDPDAWRDAVNDIVPVMNEKEWTPALGGARMFMRPKVFSTLQKTQYYTSIKWEHQSDRQSTGELLSVGGIPTQSTALMPDPNKIGVRHLLSSAVNGNQYDTLLDDARCMAVVLVPQAVAEGRFFDIFTTHEEKIPGTFTSRTSTLSSIGVKAKVLPNCIGIFCDAADATNAADLVTMYKVR